MGCYVGFKYAKNALAAGAPTKTPLGELTTLPSHRPRIVGWGGDTSNNAHPLGAFGASILALSALRSSCPPVEAWCPPMI